MSTIPFTATRWSMVICAMLGMIASAGCQPKAPAATDTFAATEQRPSPAESADPVPADESADEPPAGALRAYLWQCADGQTLVMRNLFREKAVAIDFHDGTRRLDQTIAASGVRYADPVVVFWTKGSTATLERQGAPAVKCEERRADSLREDARVRGVVFRALGNEPGWVLEIGPAGKLSWMTNFGEQRFDFDQTRSTTTDKVITFTAQQGTNAINATVKAERCVDDGEIEFEQTVTVEFDGQTYRGCGNRLNPG